MTAEIPHSQNGHGPEAPQPKEDFPVSGYASHLMVGLPNRAALTALKRKSGLPLDRVVMRGESFYMQSQLDALREWRVSQFTDNPMSPINGGKVQKPTEPLTLPTGESNTLDGTEIPLPQSVEADVSRVPPTPSTGRINSDRPKTRQSPGGDQKRTVPEGYVPVEQMLAAAGLNTHQWGSRSGGYNFDTLTIGRVKYFRTEDAQKLVADLHRKNEEAKHVRQEEERARQERIEARNAEREQSRRDREIVADQQREQKQRDRQEAREKLREQRKQERARLAGGKKASRTTRRPKPKSPTVPKSTSSKPTKDKGDKPKRTHVYSFNKLSRGSKNKVRERSPGECVHHWSIKMESGKEFGTCKKCGAMREFNAYQPISVGRRRGDSREPRPPSEISDNDIRVLDMVFSGVAISEVALQFGYSTDSVRSVVSRHIEAKGGVDNLGKGIRGLLATDLLSPSFADDLEEELSPIDTAYLSAVSIGNEDEFFKEQSEVFDARKFRNELREKMGLENDFAPIAWSILQEIEERENEY